MAKFPADGEKILSMHAVQNRCIVTTDRGLYEIRDRKAVRIELEMEHPQPDTKK